MGNLANFESFDYHDQVTGDHVRISVSTLYSILRINARDYYFNRETGKFDGTGTDLTYSKNLVHDNEEQ